MQTALACLAGTLGLVWLARSVRRSWQAGHEHARQAYRDYCVRSGCVVFDYEFEPVADPERAVKKRLLFHRGDWEKN